MSNKQPNQKKEFTDKQYYEILVSGKKVTRGAVHQINQQSKIEIERIDQKKNYQANKKNKKKEKPKPKSYFYKKIDKQDKPKILNQYLKAPSIKKFISLSKDSKKELYTHQHQSEFEQKNYFLLSKFHLPQIFRFFEQKDSFQVKSVELLQKKKQKDYLITIPNKSSAVDVKQKLQYLAVAQDLIFQKMSLKEFKQTFCKELQILKNMQIQKQNPDSMNIEIGQISEQNYSMSEKNNRFDKQHFVEIEKALQMNEVNKPDASQMKNQSDNELKQKIFDLQRIVDEGSIKNLIQQQKEIEFQEKMFRSFCLPGFQYILWPCLVYQPLKERQQILQIIRSEFYVFNPKQKSKMLEKALNFKVHSNTSESIYSNSGQLGQPMSSNNMGEPQSMSLMNEEDQKSSYSIPSIPSLPNQETFAKINEKVQKINMKSRLEVILHLLGTQKFVLSKSDFLSWNCLYTHQINTMISRTVFRSISEQLYSYIEKLNSFHKLQNAQPKDQDLKFVLNRLCKYTQSESSQPKLCIPVRCSQTKKKSSSIKNNSIQSKDAMQVQSQKKIGQPIEQKKPLQKVDQTINKLQVLVLDERNGNLSITSKQVQFNKIKSNYTLPQLGQKQKFLLYLGDFGISFQNFFQLAYSSFYFKDFNFRNVFRLYCPQKISNQMVIKNKERCIQCIYMIYDMPFVKCLVCSRYCHRECSEKLVSKIFKEVLQLQDENFWICNMCEPCIICFRAVGNKFFQCVKCKCFQHTLCSKTKSTDHSNLKQNFMCQNCIKCRICDKKLKNQEYDIVNNGYQCKNCSLDIQQKNICPICNKNEAGKWANCTNKFCQRWIHYQCDKYITSHPKIWQQSDHPYYCPLCRKLERRKVIIKCIRVLEHFDEYQFFIDPDYQNIVDYNFVIQTNMCLTKMRALCVEGRYDNNPYQLLLQDFNLLIDNALKYNMPKDQPHYQAKILNVTGSWAFIYFKEVILCSDQEIIYNSVWQKYKDRKKALFKFIYERYLEILLNYKAQNGVVEVRRPKQKHEKLNHAEEPFVFSSRYIINQIFKSSIVQFKLLKKPMKIQNLFQCPKLTQAFILPLNKNYCFFHPQNPNVVFFCQQCLEYFCCTTHCFRHRICQCGVKGCLCDSPLCGCLPLKQKQKKIYQMKIPIEKRQFTQNYKYCLKCALERQTLRICCYCKSGKDFYQFETCKICNKTYHKQCQNDQGVINLRVFYSKSNCKKYYPPNIRLEDTCYVCSCDKQRIKKTEQKITSELNIKLIKLNLITKWLNIIYQVLEDCGIKLSYSQIIDLFHANYQQFSSLQKVFQQYKLNHFKINRNIKIQKIKSENIYKNVSSFISSSKNIQSMDTFLDIDPLLMIKSNQFAPQNKVLKKIKQIYGFYDFGISNDAVCEKNLQYVRLKQFQLKLKKALQKGVVSIKNYDNFFNSFLAINNVKFQQIQIRTYELDNAKNKNKNKDIPISILAYCSQPFLYNVAYLKSSDKQQKMEQQFNQHQILSTEIQLQIQNMKKSKIRKQRQDSTLQQKLLKCYQNSKDSHISSMKRSQILYKKIMNFVQKIFQNSKVCLRKGNTCILRAQVGDWRVLKKGKNGVTYEICLKYTKGKWIYTINQNSWIVDNLQELISKTKIISKQISDFKQLSQFLGFNIKSSSIQNLNQFTAFLQNNPLDNETRYSKKLKILQVYDEYTWKNNGKAIKKEQSRNYIKEEFIPKKNKIFYLSKRNQKNQNILQKQRPAPPYISYEDLKRDLDDMALFSKPDNFVITEPKNQVFIAPSKIHKLGLFTRNFSPKNTILIEYIGEIIGQAVADERQSKFHFGCYMFGLNRRNIDKKEIIDATYRGNMARYLNHSCDPNCKAKIQVVDQHPRIFIYSIRDIKQYEQLTYDYQFNVDANDKLVCTCGAKNCQGRLN